ncbi:MAG: sensor histidine kinase [Turicibacter sp.]|nr:sensor histidine kinase [Turicibacter sp.]
MTLSDYLKSRALYLGLIAGSNVCISILFFAFEIPAFILLSYYVLLLLCLGIFIGIDFAKQRRFYDKMNRLLDQLNEKYLITEMIPETDFVEGKILRHILMETGKSMTTNVNEYARLMEEYRDYLELWIHEIKTPIASARLMIDNDGSTTAKNIGDELDKVEDYLTQALFYARSNSVEKDFVLKELDIRQVIGQALREHVKSFAEKKIDLDIDDVSGTVFSDQKWLVFILNQIVSNAVKYMVDQPKLICYTVSKAASITLYVQDHGVGIPTHDLSRIFDKGFTGENGRRFEKSTGIGLYLCKKMCEQMGIHIEVTSEVGVGTLVGLTFPISDMYFRKS